MLTANDYVNLVKDLNQTLYEQNPHLIEDFGIGFDYRTNGYVDIICFSDYQVFGDDDVLEEETVEELREIVVGNFRALMASINFIAL